MSGGQRRWRALRARRGIQRGCRKERQARCDSNQGSDRFRSAGHDTPFGGNRQETRRPPDLTLYGLTGLLSTSCALLGGLLGSGPAEDPGQAIVALVTRVFIHGLIALD